MPGQISGGPSRQRLGNQAEIDAAEAALAARSVQGVRRPLPPPAPLPEQFRDPEPAEYAVAALPMAEPPQETDETSFAIEGTVFFLKDGFSVLLKSSNMGARPAFSGVGASITEALSLAASALEEGLQQPVCSLCGQLLPQGDEA